MTVPPDVRQHCRQARTSARADGLVPALTLLLRALSPKTPPRGPRGHAILPAELLAEFAAEDAALAGRPAPENPGDERAGDTPDTGHPPDTTPLRASHTAQGTGTPPGDGVPGASGAVSGARADGVAPVGEVSDVEVPSGSDDLEVSRATHGAGTPTGEGVPGASGAVSGARADGVVPVGEAKGADADDVGASRNVTGADAHDVGASRNVTGADVTDSAADLGVSRAAQGTGCPPGEGAHGGSGALSAARAGAADLGVSRSTQATDTPSADGGASAGGVTGADAPGAGGVVSGGAVGLVPGLVLSRADGGRDGAGAEWAWAVAWLRLGMSERLRDACLAHLAARHAEGAPLLMRQLVKGTLAEVLLEHLEIEGVLDDVTAGRTVPLGPLRPADDRRLAALQEQITRADRALLRLLGAHGFTADGPGAGAHASELLADAYTPAPPGTGREDA